MSGNIAFNPQLTTVASGSFNVETVGYIQGTALNDPAVRYFLAGGVLASTETIPMWGGVAIQENVPPHGVANTLGGTIKRSVSVATITGWSVFDQNHSMLNFQQSPVPQVGVGGMVNFYRLGSGARIAVACSPTLADLEGNIITQAVSWDFENQVLEPYTSTTISSGTYNYPSAATISSGTYTELTGVVALTTNAAHGLLPGDSFVLSSMTGTGSFGILDGTFVAGTGTTGSTIDFTVATGLTMTITGGDLGTVGMSVTTAAAHGLLPGDTFEFSSLTGTGASTLDGEQTASAGTTGTTLNFTTASGQSITSITGGTVGSGGSLAGVVRVLDVQVGNSMTVTYNSVTGFLTWNRSGSTAIVLI